MNKKYKQLEDFSAIDKLSLISYYKYHTMADTLNTFNLSQSSRKKLLEMLTDNGISAHSSSESETLKHLKLDAFDLYTAEQRQEIANYYVHSSATLTCEKFNIKEYFLKLIIAEFNITKHDLITEQGRTKAAKYGFALAKTKEEKQALELSAYGTPNLSAEEKRKITNLKKFGTENVFASQTVKEKLKETKLERYGDINYTNREKATKTNLGRYGAATFLGSKSGQLAIKKYNHELYGTDYTFQSKKWQSNSEIIEKRIEARTKNKYTTGSYSELYLKLLTNADSDITELKKFVANKTIYQIADELNITRDHAYYLVSKYNLLDVIDKQYFSTSHYETEIANYIGNDLCDLNNRTVLGGKEVDIYVESRKLGIEFNGTRWHSTEIQPDKNYHFNKSKLAEKCGIRLIHIYEYEWEDPTQQAKIKLMLDIALGRVKTKLYARQCTVKPITNREAKVLNDKVHLQGHRNAQVSYGLFYKNELVQLMSFSRTKYNKNLKNENDWEIIRGCPGSNNIVVGGVSKLFKHFVNDYKPSSVFSYCDFNKFNGKSYEALGMRFIGYTGPDMKWVLKNDSVVNRKPSKHAELKEQAKAQIYGAGSKKYLIRFK